MLKITLFLIFLLIFSVLATAQTQSLNAPTKWEKYILADKNVSVLLPKMPVKVSRENNCRGEANDNYGVYSDGVAFVLSVVYKVPSDKDCYNKKDFDKQNFEDRLAELRKDTEESSVKVGKLNVVKFQAEWGTFWLFDDFQNNRWFELQVYGADESKREVKNFIQSLKIEKKPSGKEIGEGSDFNLGDETISTFFPNIQGGKKESTTGNSVGIYQTIRVILKSRPRYTEEARRSQIQGTVRLRVTFSAKGNVESVSPINDLGFGLTEQAISAAKKLIFLPAIKDGKRITVNKEVAYTFNLL